MYLTRMPLNPARRGTRMLLASPQRMHAAVLYGFPPTPATPDSPADGRVLWRTEVGRSSVLLYVSSPTEPDLTHVVEQAGWPASSTQAWQSRDMRNVLDTLRAGDQWIFRVTANPVHHRRSAAGARGKPVAHVTVAQQEAWLVDRATASGFEPLKVSVVGRQTMSFTRHTDAVARKVTVARATFDGVLQVSDPTAMRATLINGIGRARGYGCGLLTLAPLT